MNSFIKYTPDSLKENKAFVEHVLSIIDTKLQYAKHHTNSLISSSISSCDFNDNKLPFLSTLPINDILEEENEKVFSFIEKYSKTTHLLYVLRSKLNEHNVSLIYDLLNNDRFMKYEGDNLKNLIKGYRL